MPGRFAADDAWVEEAIQRGWWTREAAERCLAEAHGRGLTVLDTAVSTGLISHDQARRISRPPAPQAQPLQESLWRRLPAPGESLAGYRIDAELGRGGMGVVYAASQQSGHLTLRVALKLLLDDSGRSRERFAREAAAAASLNGHPHIVRLLSAAEVAGQPILVQELVEGETLAQRLLRGPLEPDEAWRIGLGIAAALSACHSKGILHRDLKPSNILLRESDGAPLLSDFGLTRFDGNLSLTATHETIGTVAYLAPERIEDGKGACPASDVFSAGVVLYEMVSGAKPFTGRSAVEVFAQISRAKPKAPRSPIAPLSAARSAVILSTLAKDPEERPTDGAALLAAMHAADAAAPRSRLPALTVAALALAALIGLGGWQSWVQRRDAQDKASGARLDACQRAALAELPSALVFALEPGEATLLKLTPPDLAQRTEALRGALDLAESLNPGDRSLDRARRAYEFVETLRQARPAPAQLFVLQRELPPTAEGAQVSATLTALHELRAGRRPRGRAALIELCWSGALGDASQRHLANLALSDLPTWDALSARTQDAIAELVAKRLGPRWSLVEVRVYSAGGESHRIASLNLSGPAMTLNLIPGGAVTLGTPLDEVGRTDEEFEPREVSIPPLLVSATEVTQEQWEAMTGASFAEQLRRLGADASVARIGPNLPMALLTWSEARDGLANAGLRMPSELEWEAACRAGTTGCSAFGDGREKLFNLAWHRRNASMMLQPVARFPPNAFGLYDMHGLQWELCSDTFNGEDDRPDAPRCVRGGSFTRPLVELRSGNRAILDPTKALADVGLRAVRSLPELQDETR